MGEKSECGGWPVAAVQHMISSHGMPIYAHLLESLSDVYIGDCCLGCSPIQCSGPL
jgi:hypothetical protein